jgi:hypothetical protein
MVTHNRHRFIVVKIALTIGLGLTMLTVHGDKFP